MTHGHLHWASRAVLGPLCFFLMAGCGARSALPGAQDAAPLFSSDLKSVDAAFDARTGKDSSTDQAGILDPRCPQQVPAIGDPCTPDRLYCIYERCLDRGLSDKTMLCNGDSWFYHGYWHCAPNPPGCPALPPEHLSPCDLEWQTICRWAPGSKANCQLSSWMVFGAEPPP